MMSKTTKRITDDILLQQIWAEEREIEILEEEKLLVEQFQDMLLAMEYDNDIWDDF